MAPEVIHSVQLRATPGQPDQADAQLSGQVLRTVCSVAWILVQEQGDMPTPVMAVNDCQKSSEVLTTLPLTCQEQPMPGVDVDRAEDDSPGIEPRDWHLRRLAAQPPCGAQRREEQEVRFVLEQLDTTRWQLADFPADLLFFSRARDPGRVRTGVASKRSPRHATASGSNSPRGEPRTSVPGVPQARGPSIRPPGNRMARNDGPYWREGRSEAPHPRPRGDYPRGSLPRRWAP